MLAFQAWCTEWSRELYRVLKPGGHMLAFGGTRTYHRLACAVEDAGFEIRDSIAWLYGSGFPKSLDVSKVIDKKLCIEAGTHTNDPDHTCGREVVGHYVMPPDSDAGNAGKVLRSVNSEAGINAPTAGRAGTPVTAPATDAARHWQGWGTALKPAHEPVIVGRKPAGHRAILASIGSHLDRLEDEWQAQAAAPTTRTGAAVASPAATATSVFESTATTSSSTVTSWRRCWAEISELTSTSTTETTSETTTALTILSSSLSKLTAASMAASATSPHGSTSIASAVDNLFASVVCGLRATLALSAVESATASTPPGRPDAAGANPRYEPVVVARKPLAGTVAGNVTAWGTGALNVDGCRIAHVSEADRKQNDVANPGMRESRSGFGGGLRVSTNPAGRWPANVILDESQADALDQMSGERAPGKPQNRLTPADKFGGTAYGDGLGQRLGWDPAGYTDTGGASRFFYTAKADAKERIRLPKAGAGEGRVTGLGGKIRECNVCGSKAINSGANELTCGHNDHRWVENPRPEVVAHPTVKPLTLMRWLVRLVTPPDGTVLEPFAGSGTTVEACILEGFHCIAIEREPDYLPLIVQRVNRQRDPIAYTATAGEDLGLFGFEELA
jgi:hypothetical protein